jgi:hypothetical protein
MEFPRRAFVTLEITYEGIPPEEWNWYDLLDMTPEESVSVVSVSHKPLYYVPEGIGENNENIR